MRIMIYQTTEKGQIKVGSLSLDSSGQLAKQDRGGDMLFSVLLRGVDVEDQNAIRKALSQAPQRMNGGYYRAEIVGTGENYDNTGR